MPLRLALFAAFLLLAGPLLAGSAQAQINPFKGRNGAPRLADSDVALLDQSAQKLLVDPAPSPGATEIWQNDATGAGGTVAYLGPSNRTVQGTKYACRRLKYVVTLKDRPTPRSLRAAWCHLPDGTWKLN